ncbi:MAG: AI-2E family transporter [Vicinamibacteria bacterium]
MILKDSPPWVRTLLALALVGVALHGVFLMLPGLAPFIAAFAIAYSLNPSLNRFQQRLGPSLARVPLIGKKLSARAVGVLLTLASVVTISVVFLLFAVPALISQAEEAAHSLPKMIQNVRTRVEPFLDRMNVKYPDESNQVRTVIEEKLKEKAPELLAPVSHLLQFALASTFNFISLFIHLFVVPVFAAYLLFDMNRIRKGIAGYIPPRVRPWLVGRIHEAEALLALFVRGQVTICFILAVFYALSLSALGVPLGLIVGFVIGFFNLVPFMAFIAGLPLALIVAWAGDCSSNTLLWIVVIFLIGKFGDIYVLSPRIVGESLGLHSIIVILALLLGGEYFGFVGLLLAVPATAVASVFWDDLMEAYKRSDFYRAPSSSGAPPPAQLKAE